MSDEPLTGPPIDTPEGHVHEETIPDVEETADEIEDDIDELAEALAVHSIISEERHEEILNEVETCRNQLQVLSQTGIAESPLLTQILTQLVEIRTELSTLKSSMDTRVRNHPPNESPETPMPEAESESEVVRPEAETAPPKPERKNRFV